MAKAKKDAEAKAMKYQIIQDNKSRLKKPTELSL
jgi:hypothetical protein